MNNFRATSSFHDFDEETKKGIKIAEMKVPKFAIITSSTILSLIGTIIGVGIIYCASKGEGNAETNLITLLSIIITLDVAYSFISIYRAKSELQELNLRYLKIEYEFNKRTSETIFELKRLNNIWFNLIKLNSEAAGKFNDKKYLLAIKTELESIELILNNVNYLKEELINSIGNKRANIANDIQLFINTISESKFQKIGEKEFLDSHNSIIRLKDNIRIHKEWRNVSKFEQERYLFLFKTLDNLMTQLTIGKFPLPIASNKELQVRLSFYHKKYIEGYKSDENNGYTDWVKANHP